MHKCFNRCHNCALFCIFAVSKYFVLLKDPCPARIKNKFCVSAQCSPTWCKAALSFCSVLHMSSTELCSSCSDTHAVNNSSSKPGFKIPNSWNRAYCICQCISRPFNYCKENPFVALFKQNITSAKGLII